MQGLFYVVQTTASVIACERCTWYQDESNNDVTANVESSNGCCMQIDNFVSSNATNYQYNITPRTPNCGTITPTESASMKLVAKSGTGDGLCLVISICRASRHGLLVMCRQKNPTTALDMILKILVKLISILILPQLNAVNQFDCIFGNTCTY